jgi:signal transduction histidine kinase
MMAGPGLLAMVAHDLRAPLAGLATASELLAEDVDQLDRAQIRRMAGAIRRGALWTQALVENLLCAATVREGQLRLRPAPLDVLALALEMRALVEPLLEQKDLQVRVTARGGLAEVSADGRRIGQVLVNLIANAIRVAEPGTTILVTVAGGPDGVRVAVADRGPGFPSESAARLFEPFYRAAGDGVGLGLAIVRWIAEAHGGRVGAEARPGGGACVWFELPRGARDAATEGEP